ncbi:hypothetical protein [Longimicrobium sp.]|uniref:hypothetical protein n=1 Tax=Longimicrobium sp. TaxID=2029185 RepID=UPI002E349E39|nr:hypothetical protein [Longimicrobium sp.]HEX6039703.1 hypothetical protein [Longimicrobium sp.]
MTRIALDDLVVTSFITDDEPASIAAVAATIRFGCICTADFSTCSRTSPQGGCDTSVQCVTG